MLLINRILVDIFENLLGYHSFPGKASDHLAERPQEPAPKLRVAAKPQMKSAPAASVYLPGCG